MADSSDLEARVAALEIRVEEVAADAAVARHLAAARDRDLADLGTKVDSNRVAINALGLQTAGRFDQVDQRFDRLDERIDRLWHEMRTGFTTMDRGFTEMRGKLDQTAAGHERIATLLNTLIAGQNDH